MLEKHHNKERELSGFVCGGVDIFIKSLCKILSLESLRVIVFLILLTKMLITTPILRPWIFFLML